MTNDANQRIPLKNHAQKKPCLTGRRQHPANSKTALNISTLSFVLIIRQIAPLVNLRRHRRCPSPRPTDRSSPVATSCLPQTPARPLGRASRAGRDP